LIISFFAGWDGRGFTVSAVIYAKHSADKEAHNTAYNQANNKLPHWNSLSLSKAMDETVGKYATGDFAHSATGNIFYNLDDPIP